MNNFFKKNKTVVLLGATLLILTVLLCIPATFRIFTGVFGYAAFFYLALGYAALFMKIFKKSIKLTKKQTVLIVAAVASALMTLHIGLCGSEMTNSGFGGYVGGSFENATVAGVVFSLISCPLVLPFKYIASVIIFFLLTAVLGFFIIFPHLFDNPQKRANKTKNAVDKIDTPPVSETNGLHVENLTPESDSFARQEPEELNVLPIAETEEAPLSETELAYKKMFGENYREIMKKSAGRAEETAGSEQKPTAAPAYSQPRYTIPCEEPDTDRYKIIDGINAALIPPSNAPYVINTPKSVEEAEKKLYTLTNEEYYRRRFASDTEQERTVGEEINETIRVNPYIPSDSIFESGDTTETNAEPVEPEVSDVPYRIPDEYAATETVYDDEDDEDTLPTAPDSEFMNALRQNGTDAPKPVNVPSFREARQAEYAQAAREAAPTQTAPTRITQPQAAPTGAAAQSTAQPPKPAQPKKAAEKPAAPEPKPEPAKVIRPYTPPPLKLFTDHVNPNFSPYVENLAELKEVFESTLKNYNLDMRLVETVKGPTITRCYLDLSVKCPISKVVSAQDDIARLLKTTSIIITKQIQGRTEFAIDVPNPTRGMVSLKEVFASNEFVNTKAKLAAAIGKTNDGKMIVEDIASFPHAMVAGTTGSGKSILINCIIASVFYNYTPDEVKLILVDMKLVEMAAFVDLPHMLLKKPLSDIDEIANTLKWLNEEQNRRYDLFSQMRLKNIDEYNAKAPAGQKIPRILLIVDEISELMTSSSVPKSVEANLSSLARKARAAGIHMIFATQNPTKDVISGEIQNNLPVKIACKVADYSHSMVVLKESGAEKLLGHGDMLIRKGGSDILRAQGAYIDATEIEAMVDFIRENNDCDFDEDMIERILHGSKEEIPPSSTAPSAKRPIIPEKKSYEDLESRMLIRAILEDFLQSGKVSISQIQRRFSKGYNAAANLLEYLEQKNYVGTDADGKKVVLLSPDEIYDICPDDEGEGGDEEDI